MQSDLSPVLTKHCADRTGYARHERTFKNELRTLFFKLFTWKGSEVISQESRDLKVQGTCFTLKDGDPYIWKVIM